MSIWTIRFDDKGRGLSFNDDAKLKGLVKSLGFNPTIVTDDDLTAERDALVERVKELEVYKPCEPCLKEDHDNCTGNCPSMCCALKIAESRVEELEVFESYQKAAAHTFRDALVTQHTKTLSEVVKGLSDLHDDTNKWNDSARAEVARAALWSAIVFVRSIELEESIVPLTDEIALECRMVLKVGETLNSGMEEAS